MKAAEPPTINGLFPAGVQRGQSATVKLIGTTGGEPLQVWCSRPELTGQPGPDAATVTLTAAPEAPAGVCWVRLFNAAGAARLRPFVIGTLPELAEIEPNNATTVAQTIDVTGTVVNGVLDGRAEVDVFLASLSAGQTLIASLAADHTLGSPMDGILQVVSPQGFVVQQNDDDHGIDPQIVFTAPAAGAYAVRLFAFPKDPNSTIAFAGGDEYVYRLTLTTGPFADRVVPKSGDPAGAYQLVGWNILEPLEVVALQTDGRLAAALPVPGTWEFERLPFVPSPVQHEANPAATVLPLLVPGAMWGSIERSGDRDVYSFHAAAGVKYSLSIAAQGIGSPLDAVLTIRDAAGTVLDQADDGSGGSFDPTLTLVPATDGQHQIEITDRFEFGGERYFYVLLATPERPDYALELEQDAFTLPVGQPLEVKLKVVRSGGMQESVTLAIEGLPPGVTASMTSPEPDATGNMVVPNGTDAVSLKLEAAEGTTYSGALSIVGTAGSEPLRRPATAALIQQPLRTPHIWLTVAPQP